MEREKQIEEMARDICHLTVSCEECVMLARKTGRSKKQYCKAMQYAERAYNAGYRKASDAINEFAEELINRFNDLECNANTPKKTVRVDELRAQMDWMLHEVAPNIIKEFANKYVEAMK